MAVVRNGKQRDIYGSAACDHLFTRTDNHCAHCGMVPVLVAVRAREFMRTGSIGYVTAAQAEDPDQ